MQICDFLLDRIRRFSHIVMSRFRKSSQEFVVVIRASGKLRLERNEQLRVQFEIEGKDCLLTFRTRYLEEGFVSTIPRDLWIEAKGQYNDLVSAVTAFTNAASFFTNVISFCTNGDGGTCRFHLAFDNTPYKKKREFFEQFIASERGLPPITRKINPEYCKYFIDSLAVNEFGERLRRGINQYCLALENWTKGKETLATAHLFMGMEALVPVIRKIEMRNESVATRQELADRWGIETKNLEAVIRRELLFQGDSDCHRDAKKASDGFEHGFLSYAEIRPLAEGVRNDTARYLRGAIIKILDLPKDIEDGLLSPPYENPIGTENYIRYLRGTLISDHNSLASERNEYPIIEWAFSVSSFEHTPEGKLNMGFSQSLTPQLGEGVQFKPRSVELYGPEGIITERSHSGPIQPEILPASIKPSKEYLDYVNLLETLASRSHEIGKGELIRGGFRSEIFLHLISRSRSTFSSILSLLKLQLGEESLLLYKSLFQDSVKLIYLGQCTDELDEELVNFKHHSINETKKLISIAEDQGYMGDAEEVIQNLDIQQEAILGTVRKDLEELSSQLTAPISAQPEYVSNEGYWLFCLAQLLSEGNLLPIPNRTRRVEDEQLHYESTTTDVDLLIRIGTNASELFVESHKSVCSMFGWAGIEDLESMLGNLKTLASQLNTSV